eukprot:1789595-Prymnesium_polylepis.1
MVMSWGYLSRAAWYGTVLPLHVVPSQRYVSRARGIAEPRSARVPPYGALDRPVRGGGGTRALRHGR